MKLMAERKEDNAAARSAWDANAGFWDERMGEGNDFFRTLLWPALERLVGSCSGARILDVACGNGVTSRRLAALGAKVVAVDFSEALIALAKERSRGAAVDHRVVDATDHDALVALGDEPFDVAVCNMGLMDMADIHPLMRALRRLLKAGGRFVFSVMHPCFNNPTTVQMSELEDREGTISTTYSVKVSRYLRSYSRLGAAMSGQPVPHPYFHRSLQTLLAPALELGFVLDGFEEPAFPAEHAQGSTPLSWSGRFSEIPPVLVARLTAATSALPSREP
jgi:2-polyprenyl-3-methyl-5-hydroxy-6-metoxy-1,4-benzoquinol methylase